VYVCMVGVVSVCRVYGDDDHHHHYDDHHHHHDHDDDDDDCHTTCCCRCKRSGESVQEARRSSLPLMHGMNPFKHLGLVSERFYDSVEDYVAGNLHLNPKP